MTNSDSSVKTIRFMPLLAWICIGAVIAVAAPDEPAKVSVAGADAFIFSDANPFTNSIFEFIQPGAKFPRGVRVNAKAKDWVRVVNDYKQAFHGNIYIAVDRPTDQNVWLGAVVPSA